LEFITGVLAVALVALCGMLIWRWIKEDSLEKQYHDEIKALQQSNTGLIQENKRLQTIVDRSQRSIKKEFRREVKQ
jgi:uncharacterized protein HemX